MPTQRDRVWGAAMQLILADDSSTTTVKDVSDRLAAETDNPPSRKIVYDCLRAMEDLGLVESADQTDQDPTTTKTVALDPPFQILTPS